MAEPWIRVHANLAAKPVVWRAVDALGISQPEAVGLLVIFWGNVSQHAANGTVAGFPDAQLEAWAGWTRKRGKFAAFIRAVHLDEDGRVNEWDEYAGVLEEQRRQSRIRKRKSLGRDREEDVNSQGIHSEVREPPHLRDETRRNEIEEQLLQRPPNGAEAEAEAGLAVLLESDADRNALTVVVARAADRFACLTSFASMLTGNDPATPRPTPAAFGQALRDLAANGQRPSARLMRGYLRDVIAEQVRAGRGAPGVPPSGASAPAVPGARREKHAVRDTGRATLVLGQIKGLMQETRIPGQATARMIPKREVEALGPDVLAAYEAVGGSDRLLNTESSQMTWLIKEFALALESAEAAHV